MLTTYSLPKNLSTKTDSLLDFELVSSLDQALVFAQDQLQNFAYNPLFQPQLALAFGNKSNVETLQADWRSGDFSILSRIEIRTGTELNGAKGAYSASTDQIYLSQEFLRANQNNIGSLASVLLEEAGHRIDAKLNAVDSAGDEGAIFSRIVQNIPTSDTQLAQLKAEDDHSTITLQNGQQINVEQAGIYTGNNLKTELQNAIPNLLDKVKNFINTDVLQGLPLLGNQLGLKNPLDTLFDGFKTQILGKLAIAPDIDPVAEAKQALLEVLSGALNLLQDGNGDNVISLEDIDAIEGADSVTFKIKLGQSVKTSVNLNEDIGLPALGLKLTGGVTPDLAFNWNLEFGVDKNTGFFLNNGGAAPELSLNLKTQLVDSLGAALELEGKLGFLGLKAKDQGSLLQGDFSVDLQNDLAALSVVPKFVGNANLKLGLEASFGGSSKLPTIGTDFNLNWGFAPGFDGKTAGVYAGSAPNVTFDNVTLDMGTFFKDFASPVFGKLDDVLGPIRPLLDVSQARLPIVDDLGKSFLDQNGDGKVSLIDLAKLYQPDSTAIDFIDALGKVDALTQAITNLSGGSGKIPLNVGKFSLGAGNDVRSAGFKLSTVDLNALLPIDKITKTADEILAELGGFEINGTKVSDFTSLVSAVSGDGSTKKYTPPEFPILTDPNQVFKLLLGQDAEFFKYTLPELSYKSGFDVFIPILGPLGAQFIGDFGARVQVAVGYDSYGINKFSTSGDANQIFDGFYIDRTPDPTGPAGYKSGGQVTASIAGYAAINLVALRAGAGGEIRSNLDVQLNDLNKDGDPTKVHLDEFSSCIFDPVTGKIDAYLNAFIKIGIGPFSIKKKFDLAKKTLLDFALGCNSAEKAQTAINGVLATTFPDHTLSLNMGTTAADRILNGVAGVDNDEAFTVNYKSGNPDDATLIIGYSDITKEYKNINKIVANGGNKGDVIVIGDQVFTNAELTGGNEGEDEFGDQLFGGSGNDIIKGEGGNDSLYGGAGIDNLDGGTGDDFLNGGAGADILNGGDGFDTISYRDSKEGIRILTNFDVLVGVQGDASGDQITNIEQIEGTNFFDAIQGDSLNNVFEGFDGDDNLEGKGGDDVLIGGLGRDRLDGGDGSDWTSYYTSQAGVTVNLFSGKASRGEAEGDVLISIENVGGSAYGDNLTGNFADNYIDGFYGDDKIQGSFGADTLDGGAGNDTAIYQDSFAGVNVSLKTGSGSGGDAQGDTLKPTLIPNPANPELPIPSEFNSFENLIGSRFSDTLEGDIGDNKLEGLAGDDTLRGESGNDMLIGGAGADFLDGGLGIDTADYSGSRSGVNVFLQGIGSGGDAQGDTFAKTSVIFGNSTVENLIGSKFGDTLIADGGFNTIAPRLSSGGFDFVDGGANADLLIVDYSERDTGTGLVGGYNLGSVASGSFSRLDTITSLILDRINFSNIESLKVIGTSKNDTIYGGAGNDVMFTGDGNDLIYGGFGANRIFAGDGNDVVVDQNNSARTFDSFPSNTFGINLDGGRGIDTLSIDLSGQISRDNIVLIGLDPTVENLNQSLTLKDGTAITNFEIFKDIKTSAGNDTLIQLGRVDNNFSTNSGIDTINAGLGIDVVSGGNGANNDEDLEDDLLILDYSVGDIGTGMLADFSQNDAKNGGRFYRNTLDGTLLDQVTISDDFERFNITGTSQNDQIYGGFGNDILIGNDGNDVIIGNEGNDLIDAGDGDDRAIAGLGNDLIDGGNGNDNISDRGVTFRNGRIVFTDGGGNDFFNGGAGNDFIVGGQGNDILNGGADNDVLIGVDYGVNQFEFANRDRNQVDTLTGGTGADEFWLGDGSYVYYDDLLGFINGGRLNYALIKDFQPLENDLIQLKGIQANYSTQVVNGNTEIYLKEFFVGDPITELIGIVQGVTDFDLGANYVRYVNAPNAIAAQANLIPAIERVNNLNLVQDLALSDALSGQVLAESLISNAQSASISPSLAPIPSLAAAGDFSISQNGDGDALLANFLGTVTGLSNFNVNLKGSSQAFGTFTDDPFGLGSGIVLSTGKVADLAGANTTDGGLSTGTNTKLTFTKIGSVGGSALFRANLSDLGFDLKSLTFADSGSLFGGSPGQFTGFDLDAIRLSNQLITSGADINLATPINAFNFSPVGTIFTPGTQRQPTDPAFPNLAGTINGYINNGVASLADFDYGFGVNSGFASLGDNGKVGFNLTSPVPTNQPLYLYVAEAGDNGEKPDGLISASNREINSLSDLSTDFGILGVADDTISMEVEFDADASTTNVYFQFVFGSEELLEYAGKFNDAFSLELNGINLATLSNGNEVTINNLATNPIGPYSPDLIYNPSSAPKTLQTKLDGYTKLLTFVGEVIPNSVNKLVITVKDNRDGLLDSAVFLKAGSFSITPPSTGLTQIVDINIVNGGTTSTFAGSPSGVVGQVLASDTDLTPIKTIFESELEGLTPSTNVVLQANGNISVGFIGDNAIALQNPALGDVQTSLTIAADFDGNGSGDFLMNDPVNTSIQALGRNVNISGANVTSGSISTYSATIDGASGSIDLAATNNLDVQAVNNFNTDIVNYGNITFTGNEINLNAGNNTVRGNNKNLILQSFAPDQTIEIGSADSGSANILDITATDLAAIADGFNLITIGRSDGTGAININANVSFSDPVFLRSPNGQLNINATVSLIDNSSLSFSTILPAQINTGGAIVLGANEQIDNSADINLNGGKLNFNGFDETLDLLTISSNSSIDFGLDSSDIVFSNSSSQAWSGLLTINDWQPLAGESLRFGNDSTGLTSTQLSQIQFTGFNLGTTIDSFGFVTPIIEVGKFQEITSQSNLKARSGQTVSIPLIYNTSTADNTLPGVGLRLHYNSSSLAYKDTTNLLSTGVFGSVSDIDDTQNYDADVSTDRYLQFQYFDITGNWPDQTLPLKLGDFNFTAQSGFAGTQLNVTSPDGALATGYGLDAETILVGIGAWNLDIDGDGKVEAATDGTMLVRYLFGPAFAGSALTNGAISPTATRNLPQIQDYLQEGVSQGHLDIDGNGSIGALSDGIIAMRYLSGFSGNALIDAAIAPNATRDLAGIQSYLSGLTTLT